MCPVYIDLTVRNDSNEYPLSTDLRKDSLMPVQQVIMIPFSGQLIGQGYNSETGESVGTALEVDSVFEDGVTDAQTGTTQFESVETQDSLKECLGISANVDVRVGLFAGGAKMSFSEQHSVNSSSSYVVGRSFIQNAIRHGKGFRLTPEAQKLIDADDMDGFRKAFGDRFVRSLTTGGEVCVVARITSSSDTHQTDVKAALHGEYNGILSSGSFQAAFDSAKTDSSIDTEVSVKLLQAGGQGDELSFTGPKAIDILERLKHLPDFIHQHATGLESELATYDTIPIPVKTAEEHEDRIIVLHDCATQKALFLRAISDLELTLDDDGRLLFDDLPPKDQLIAMTGQYRAALSALLAHAIKVSTGVFSIPPLFVADPRPPALNFKRKISTELGDVMAARGEALAASDPLALLLRDQPGHSRLAFCIGLAESENQTLPGPGKDRIREALALADRASFQQAVDYSLDRNNNLEFATKGAAVIKLDNAVADARGLLPLSVAWLGFNIATGIFGSKTLGALGNTSEGPHSDVIRNRLSTDGQKGFKAAVAFHLKKAA
jgi:hypothetical protein